MSFLPCKLTISRDWDMDIIFFFEGMRVLFILPRKQTTYSSKMCACRVGSR